MKLIPWRCPVCSEPLNLSERSFSCANRHTFDIAKEGYVNLLLPNKKKSADPGDSKAMLQSRRAFLERGFYEPLADALLTQIQSRFPDKKTPLTVLDTGCGEGYYLGRLAEKLGERAHLVGVDISRPALQMTGKRYANVQGAVASTYDIPLPDNSVDVVIRVFAPASDDEIARVLRPGGLYLWVYPGAQHLFALRELIYDEPQPHGVHMAVTAGLGLLVERMEEVTYPVNLPDAAAVAGLLEMTPYYWSASKEKQEYCLGLEKLDLGADFRMVVAAKEGVFTPTALPKFSKPMPPVKASPVKATEQVKVPEVEVAGVESTGIQGEASNVAKPVKASETKPAVAAKDEHEPEVVVEKKAFDPWGKAVQKVKK